MGIAIPISATSPTGSLFLTNGGQLSGEWRDNASADEVSWQPPFTNEPYAFPWGNVAYAQFPPPREAAAQPGAYRIDTTSGDVLVGDLVDVNPEWVTLAVNLGPRRGEEPIKVARASIRSITRTDGAGGRVYMGPDPLSEWTTGDGDAWRYSQGALSTSRHDAVAYRGMTLPEKALIEIEVSWKVKADFSLELGVPRYRGKAIGSQVGADEELANLAEKLALPMRGRVRQAPNRESSETTNAFRLETVSDYLVAVRETDEATNLTIIRKLDKGAGRVSLLLYLDQPQNRLVVTSLRKEQLAELSVDCGENPLESGVLLTNREGDIQLDKLYVSEWNGESPTTDRTDQPSVTLTDGKIVYGEVVGYQPDDKKLLFAKPPERHAPAEKDVEPDADASPAEEQPEETEEEGADETLTGDQTQPAAEPDSEEPDSEEPTSEETPNEVALDDIAYIYFALPQSPSAAPARPDNLLTVVSHEGLRITGVARGVANQELSLSSESLEQPLHLPLSEIRSVRTFAQPQPVEQKWSVPRLEVEGLQTSGELTGAEASPGGSCLLWRPQGSRNAVALRNDASGRIDFRLPKESKPDDPTLTPRRRQPNNGIFGAIGAIFSRKQATSTSRESHPTPSQPAMMYLRLGDKIPCKIDRIDEQGVFFSSPYSNADFATHENIKAIELVIRGVDGRLTSDRRDHLLTLPRMRAQNPPTHLLVSTRGDYVRCRLLRLTEKTADVEIGLEETQLDRSRIARIIWLDPPPDEDDEPTSKKAEELGAADQLRVQAVRRDGVRLTFRLQAFETPSEEEPAGASKDAAPALVGASDVLAACVVKLADIDVLLFGDRIEQAAAELSYQRWKMRHAIEPRDVIEGESEDVSAGFPLVGLQAPELQLPFFNQGDRKQRKEFKVVDYKGDVLILDFWASWCGPCMQAMPKLQQIGNDYADKGVHVVAVNLQDSAEEIRAALLRLKIEPTIALDRDGVAAQRYQVTGIPQTVLIDREGNVANVFVGGNFEEKLRNAIDAALAEAEDAP
ncbi:Thiol:disulfide interchange protein CycY precursor [Planctomycetes bacterium K2D]|uniref:Thiol:disulfide interchange protein CycY n=2 Tax=Botrimarina mediterranea TaxID=2528022 RepID=A0A518KC91_9BACT|nr:Thiol:disulfide interchange protein CycY precursor [Botrimarina mediterranea]QDV80053.1 Thiol:disulfide interchange protein CycY precursor [Planctomycetes bacterium K2D]